MNERAQAEDNARFEEPSIVSVNSRGAQSNDMAKKLTFIALIAGLCIIGAFYALNKIRASQKEAETQTLTASRTETKSAQVGTKRNFETDGKTPSTEMEMKPPSAGCKEMVLLNPSGEPIIGNDGKPLRVGCDGKIAPSSDARTPSGADRHGAQGGAAAPIPLSRFRGDVLIKTASNSSTLKSHPQGQSDLQTGEKTTELLHQLMTPKAPLGDTAAGGLFASAQAMPVEAAPAGIPNQQGLVGAMLTPTTTHKVTATDIGDRNMLLAKGSQIDCALTTRIINEVSGFASCLLTSNVYSDNGKVLLLERGSKAEGEYVAQMQQGQRRLFVLWQRMRTPEGPTIAISSPAADGLGTMGLDGHVDNRWWDRLGAAFMLSFVKDAIALETAQSSEGPTGAIVYQNSVRSGEQMAERVLSSTINIKPTIYKNQGDRASIYIARDLDFSTVYALRAH